MKKSIHRELLIPKPREQVWDALANSVTLAEWMYPNDFQPTIGHHFTFQVPPNPQAGFSGIVVHCEVLECDPPNVLVFSWSAAGLVNTRVCFRLETAGDGTRVLFEHASFDMLLPFGEAACRGAEYGWGKMLKQWALIVTGISTARD